MSIPTDMVGERSGPIVHTVDARWTMAYAASLGDRHACYFDTRRPGGVVAHPLFAVCPEWPVIVQGREIAEKWGIPGDEIRRAVHASHATTIHRLIVPGDELRTTLSYTGVERRSRGAYTSLRLDTVDAAGAPVATTEQGVLYLGVETTGPDRPCTATPPPRLPPEPGGDPLHRIEIPVAHGAAHLYSEAARIWNPIHTDAAVAAAAGLPGIILHGTATLALGVSAVIDALAGDEPARVRGIAGRFGAMVHMPSTLTVEVFPPTPDAAHTAIAFAVRTETGAPAVDRGCILLA